MKIVLGKFKNYKKGYFLIIKINKHITIDFLSIKKDYSPEFYEKFIYKIAKASKVEILNVSSHKFEPQGFTLVALLSENHFSFHTFPEKDIINFYFFTCGKFNPKVSLKILRKKIKHKKVVSNAFEKTIIELYNYIYSTAVQKKFYLFKNVLKKFTSKLGQFV
jgi:S-adenosylmethionine decarboxylase proenzyme, Bacillus form